MSNNQYPQQNPYNHTNGAPVNSFGAAPQQNQFGYAVNPMGGGQYQQQSTKSSVVAGILQLFFGGLGIGNFYTGKTMLGVAQLVLTLIAFPLDLILIGFLIHAIVGIWCLIEAILYFMKSGSYGFDGNHLPLQ